jgi:hypothetical protein
VASGPTPPAATATPNSGGSGTPAKLGISGVSASGSDDGAPPTNVVDGNTNSFWLLSNAPASAWLQLDLGTNKQVAEVRYFVLGTGHAPSTKIQYSTDGVNWTTLPNANGIDTGAIWGWNSVNAGKVTARYVRFYLDNPNRAVWNLGFYSEMQVWGN